MSHGVQNSFRSWSIRARAPPRDDIDGHHHHHRLTHLALYFAMGCFSTHASGTLDPPEVRNWRIHLIALIASMSALASKCRLGVIPAEHTNLTGRSGL
jgi:VanZ family protein